MATSPSSASNPAAPPVSTGAFLSCRDVIVVAHKPPHAGLHFRLQAHSRLLQADDSTTQWRAIMEAEPELAMGAGAAAAAASPTFAPLTTAQQADRDRRQIDALRDRVLAYLESPEGRHRNKERAVESAAMIEELKKAAAQREQAANAIGPGGAAATVRPGWGDGTTLHALAHLCGRRIVVWVFDQADADISPDAAIKRNQDVADRINLSSEQRHAARTLKIKMQQSYGRLDTQDAGAGQQGHIHLLARPAQKRADRFLYHLLHRLSPEECQAYVSGLVLRYPMVKNNQSRIVHLWSESLQYGLWKDGAFQIKGVVPFWAIREVKPPDHTGGKHTITLVLEATTDSLVFHSQDHTAIQELFSFFHTGTPERLGAIKHAVRTRLHLEKDAQLISVPSGTRWWDPAFSGRHLYPPLFSGALRKRSHGRPNVTEKRFWRLFTEPPSFEPILEYYENEQALTPLGIIRFAYLSGIRTQPSSQPTKKGQPTHPPDIILLIDAERQFDLATCDTPGPESDRIHSAWLSVLQKAFDDSRNLRYPVPPGKFWKPHQPTLTSPVAVREFRHSILKQLQSKESVFQYTVEELQYPLVSSAWNAFYKANPKSPVAGLLDWLIRVHTQNEPEATWTEILAKLNALTSGRYAAVLLLLAFVHAQTDPLNPFRNASGSSRVPHVQLLMPEQSMGDLIEFITSHISTLESATSVLLIRLLYALSLGLLSLLDAPEVRVPSAETLKRWDVHLKKLAVLLKDADRTLMGHREYCIMQLTIVQAVFTMLIKRTDGGLNKAKLTADLVLTAVSFFTFGLVNSHLNDAGSDVAKYIRKQLDHKHIEAWFGQCSALWQLSTEKVNTERVTRLLADGAKMADANANLGGGWQVAVTYVDVLRAFLRKVAQAPTEAPLGDDRCAPLSPDAKRELNRALVLLPGGLCDMAKFQIKGFRRDFRVRAKAIHVCMCILLEQAANEPQLKSADMAERARAWVYESELIADLEDLLLLRLVDEGVGQLGDAEKRKSARETIQQFLTHHNEPLTNALANAMPRVKHRMGFGAHDIAMEIGATRTVHAHSVHKFEPMDQIAENEHEHAGTSAKGSKHSMNTTTHTKHASASHSPVVITPEPAHSAATPTIHLQSDADTSSPGPASANGSAPASCTHSPALAAASTGASAVPPFHRFASEGHLLSARAPAGPSSPVSAVRVRSHPSRRHSLLVVGHMLGCAHDTAMQVGRETGIPVLHAEDKKAERDARLYRPQLGALHERRETVVSESGRGRSLSGSELHRTPNYRIRVSTTVSTLRPLADRRDTHAADSHSLAPPSPRGSDPDTSSAEDDDDDDDRRIDPRLLARHAAPSQTPSPPPPPAATAAASAEVFHTHLSVYAEEDSDDEPPPPPPPMESPTAGSAVTVFPIPQSASASSPASRPPTLQRVPSVGPRRDEGSLAAVAATARASLSFPNAGATHAAVSSSSVSASARPSPGRRSSTAHRRPSLAFVTAQEASRSKSGPALASDSATSGPSSSSASGLAPASNSSAGPRSASASSASAVLPRSSVAVIVLCAVCSKRAFPRDAAHVGAQLIHFPCMHCTDCGAAVKEDSVEVEPAEDATPADIRIALRCKPCHARREEQQRNTHA